MSRGRTIIIAGGAIVLLGGVAIGLNRALSVQPPASPMSSADRPTPKQGPLHSREIREEDGRTLLWAGTDPASSETLWFDMTDALVDPVKFQYGIGKDRIPSIDEPVFAPADDPRLAEARIGDETDVIGVVHNGIAKAYPIFIVDRCEVVNDTFKEEPIAVLW